MVSLSRVEFAKQFRKERIDGVLVSSVHDSLVADVKEQDLNRTAELLLESVKRIPILFRERFGIEFNLPLTAEISYGNNMKELTEWKRQ